MVNFGRSNALGDPWPASDGSVVTQRPASRFLDGPATRAHWSGKYCCTDTLTDERVATPSLVMNRNCGVVQPSRSNRPAWPATG